MALVQRDVRPERMSLAAGILGLPGVDVAVVDHRKDDLGEEGGEEEEEDRRRDDAAGA
jgi:hypothetical protein